MNFREATTDDIAQIQAVRNSVNENALSHPSRVTDENCREYLVERGKGWVCEIDGVVVAFAIADLVEKSVWALFVRPEFEGRGIGSQLHDIMLEWYSCRHSNLPGSVQMKVHVLKRFTVGADGQM